MVKRWRRFDDAPKLNGLDVQSVKFAGVLESLVKLSR